MKILNWAICLIIFCLPLYLVRFNIFSVPTTVLELMIYGLFLFWLIKKGYKNLFVFLQENKLLFLGIILLLIGVSIAAFFSWDTRTSAGILKAWFVDPLLFFAVFITTIKKKDINNVFYALILSGFVVAIIALVYLAQGNLNYQGRLQGIYDSPNYLAMYLAIPLILSLRLAPKKIYLIGASLIILVALIFTKSFGALFGIFGALIVGLGLNLANRTDKTDRTDKIYLLALIFLAFALIFAIGMVKIKTLEGLKSFDARFVIWQKAWQIFKSYPLIGIGPGTFQDYFPLFPKWGVPQPHNIFLAFLMQTGIVGFIGFIFILIWFFKRGFKNKDWFSLLLMMSMAYILIHGLVDTTYWKNDLAMLFWIIIGMTAVFYNSIEYSNPSPLSTKNK